MSRILDLMFGLTGDSDTKNVTAQNTPPLDDNTKKLAATEFLRQQFTGAGKQSLSANGYQKLPGGLILQWGTFNATMAKSTAQTLETYSGGSSITFPIPFRTAVFHVEVTTPDNTVFTCEYVNISAKTISGFSSVVGGIPNSTGGPANYTFNNYTWFAIGY